MSRHRIVQYTNSYDIQEDLGNYIRGVWFENWVKLASFTTFKGAKLYKHDLDLTDGIIIQED